MPTRAVQQGDVVPIGELIGILHPSPRKAAPGSGRLPKGQARQHQLNMAAGLAALLRAVGLPLPRTEYRFHTRRRWRMDYAWPELHLFLEIEGGVWINGRHTRGSGYVRDLEKYNTAAAMGWRLIRCQPRDMKPRKGRAPAVLGLLMECLPHGSKSSTQNPTQGDLDPTGP